MIKYILFLSLCILHPCGGSSDFCEEGSSGLKTFLKGQWWDVFPKEGSPTKFSAFKANDHDLLSLPHPYPSVTQVGLSRTAIRGPGLSILEKKFPGLQELDLEGSEFLDTLCCLPKGTLNQLKTLNLAGTPLGNAEFYRLVKRIKSDHLISLNLKKTGITKIDPAFLAAKASFTNLQELSLDKNRIPGRTLLAFIHIFPNLRSLSIQPSPHFMVEPECFEGFAEALPALKTLRLGKVCSKAVENLTQGVFEELETLSLKVKADGLIILSRALSQGKFPKLKTLDLSGSNLVDLPEDAPVFLAQKSLLSSGGIEDPDVILESIRGHSVLALAAALKKNTTLGILKLERVKIRDIGAIYLAGALKRNTTLKKLILCCAGITDSGAVALAESFKTNWSLEKLDLSFNRIKDSGALAFVAALGGTTNLKKLYLNFNCIGDTGVIALAAALEKIPHL